MTERRYVSRQVLARCLGALAVLASVLVVAAPDAGAVVNRAFTPRFATTTNGAIDLYGGPSLICPISNSLCVQGLAGTGSATNDNSWSMVNLDADADASTFNSSAATVASPAGSTILFAGLYWQGYRATSTTAVNTMKFKVPGAANYTNITATTMDYAPGGNFQGFADVTSLLNGLGSSGNGTYWGANVNAALGGGAFGGWSLVIAYENPAEPLRSLTVFDGLASVDSTPVNISVSGFLTPPFGTVQAEVGVVAGEGDLGTSGDAFALAGTVLSDTLNPANNFFNSSITSNGTADGARNPNYKNTYGWDVDEVNASGILPNNSTSTTLTLSTSGDVYFPGVVTFAVDLYAPSFPDVTKTVVDLNGGVTMPGDTLEYSTVLSNTGLDPAINAVLTDVLPANVTFVPGSLTVVSGANAGTKTDATGDDQGEFASGMVRVRVGTGATATAGGTLNPGDTTTVKFRVTVQLAAAGTTVSNKFKLDYRAKTIKKDLVFTSNAAEVTVAPVADLKVKKTVSADPVVAGSPFDYTISVTNQGPSAAAAATVADVLPAGLSLVSVTPSQGSCTALPCNLGTLANGASATVTVRVLPAATLTAGSVIVNTATVSSTTSDLVPGNNAAGVKTTVSTSADLSITKSASPDPVVPGQGVTWTVTVHNAGPSVARSVVMVDGLPTEVNVVSATPTVGTCPVLVECAFGDLAPGANAVVTITADVDPRLLADLHNEAKTGSVTSDPDGANNYVSIDTPVQAEADLDVEKLSNAATAIPGTPHSWTVTVTNKGPSVATAVTMADSAPSGVTFTSASPGTGSCSVTASQVDCDLGDLDPGASIVVTIHGDLAASLADGSLLNNTATATTATYDGEPGNDQSTASTPVNRVATLEFTKSASPDPVVAGTQLTYTLMMKNLGPSNTSNATIVDTVPASTTFVSATAGCTNASGTVTCNTGNLAAGATATVTIVVAVAPAAAPPLVNYATAVADDAPQVTASVNSVLTANADLRVTKWASGVMTAGNSGSWVIAVRNYGPSVATGVTVTDPLPSGFIATAATPTQGSCSVTTTVTCSLGSIPVGATVQITVDVNLAATLAAGAWYNTATATATTADETPSNNSATGVAMVVRRADLVLDKSGPATITAGGTASWTVVVRNDGPSTADTVTVVDTLPSGVSFVTTGSSGACTAAGATVTCIAGTLAVGGSATFTVVGQLASSAAVGSTLVNSATASSATPDAAPSNNTDSASTTVTGSANLSIAKSGPAVATAGGAISWTLEVRNAGTSDATNVTISDAIGSWATVTSVSTATPGASCTSAVSCSIPNLPAGSTATVTIQATLAATLAEGASVANTATVAATTADPDNSDNSSTVTTLIERRSDVRVAKAAVATTVNAGDQATWTITVSNAGPSEATGVEVSDSLPPGVTLASMSTAGSSCSATTCSLGTVSVGQTVTITVVVNVPAATVAGTTLTNTASVTSTTADSNHANNTASADITVTTRADVAITKTHPGATATAGEATTWNLTVVNYGPSTAQSVVVSDTLPTGVSGIAATPTAGSCSVAGSTVTCTLATLSPGAIVSISVTGTVAASTADGTTLSNTASAVSTTADTITTNNTASVDTVVRRVADLRVSKAAVGAVVAGSNATWLVTVTNLGPSDTTAANLVDTLPAGVTLVGAVPSQGSCALASCSLGALAVGASATVTVTGAVASTVSGTIANTATGSSLTNDPVPTNNTATTADHVDEVADLRVTKTLDTPLVAGAPVRWTVTVTNDGPSVARNAELHDLLPTGLTAVSATPSTPSCTASAAAVNCAFGTLAAGASVTVTVNATVQSTMAPGGSMVNGAQVRSDATDPDPSDNTTTATGTMTTSADLSVTKTASPATFTPGQTATWTIIVRNDGVSVASGATVSDTLPNSVLAAGITATATVGSCSVATRNVSCAFGDLAVGATATVTVTGTIDPSTTAAVSNTAIAGSATPDPDSTDLSATSNSAVSPSANLRISKAQSPDPVTAGNSVTWTMKVTNDGPSTATGVVVADTLPGSTTLTGATADVGTCTSASPLSCTVGTLSVGQTATITVTAAVAPAFNGGIADATLSNTATVSAATTDPVLANNTATASGVVRNRSDIAITKTISPTTATAGTAAVYTLAVTNNGPSTAYSATVTDTLPTSLTAGVLPLGCTKSGQTITCSVPSLAVGATASLLIPVTISSSATEVHNEAAVSAANDTNASNNIATHDLGPSFASDLQITKAALVGSVTAGTDMTWRLTVSNAGPSDYLANVQLADTLPAGLTFVTASGASCSEAAGVVACAVASSLAAGATRVVDIVTHVDAAQAVGTVTNTATVSGTDAANGDPSPSNNTDSAPVNVVRSTTLRAAKVMTSPMPVVAGTPVTFQVTVTNDGPSTATGVVVSDPMPAGFVATSANPATDCILASGTVTCALGTLAVGASRIVTISATPDAGLAAGSFTNTAHVSSTTPSTPVDASVTSVITRSANLSVTKSVASGYTVVAGSPTRWELAVTNAGPSTAESVVISDPLPAGATFVAASVPGGSCSFAAGTVTCSVPAMLVGQVARVTVDAALSTTLVGALTNTATVTAATPDPDSANNSAGVTSTVQTSADLHLGKSSDTSMVAGSSAQWTVTLSNAGPSAARNVVIADPSPAGFSATSAVVSPSTLGSCSVTAALVSCSFAVVDSGVIATVTILGDVAASVANGSTLTNRATVTSATSDPDGSTNAASATGPVVTAADLSILKTGAAEAIAGTATSWTVAVTNNGPSVARSVVMADTMPTGVLPSTITATADTGSCSIAAPLVTCSFGDLAPDAVVLVQLTATVDPYRTSSLQNTATVSSPTSDANLLNNSATVSTPVVASADLEITKTVSPDPVVAGTPVTWTIAVTNHGPSAARAVDMEDVVPAGTTATYATSPQGACSMAAAVSCALGTLAVGQTLEVTILAEVDPNYGATTEPADLSNTASVTSTTTDPDGSNNESTASATVTHRVQVSLRKEMDPVSPVAGTNATYLLTALNAGPSTVLDAVVTDTLPAGVTVTSLPADCSLLVSTLTCSAPALAPSNSYVFAIGVALAPSATSLHNEARLTASNDVTTDDDVAVHDVGPAFQSDLRLTKEAVASPVVAGETATWRFTVENLGPSDYLGAVHVVDVLPTGLTYVGSTVPCAPVAGTLVCDVANSLNAGGFVSFEVETSIDPAHLAGPVTNTAAVRGDDPTNLDPTMSNNTSSATVKVERRAVLAGVKRVLSPAVPTAGVPVTFEITVTNNGPSTATGVAVNDQMPAGFVPSSASPSPQCLVIGAVVSCALGTLGVTESRTVTIVAMPDPSLPAGPFTNSAQITSTTPSEPVTAVVTSALARSANLVLSKHLLSPEQHIAGQISTWELTVENEGPSTAETVELVDELPAGVEFVSFSTPTGSCEESAGTLTCQLTMLPPGAAVHVLVEAFVDTEQRGSLTNAATVASPTPDPDTEDNSASTTDEVAAVADLSIVKTGPARVVAGTQATWVLTVTNEGPSTATEVLVEDLAPVGTAMVSATMAAADGECETYTSGVRCEPFTLPAHTSVSITVVGIVDSSAQNLVENTATVTAAELDPVLSDNSSTVRSEVDEVVDLQVRKTASADPAVNGGETSWVVEVKNLGPSRARSVVLTDPNPAGFQATAVVGPAGTQCGVDAAGVVCDLGNVDPSEVIKVSISGRLVKSGLVTNVASVTSSGKEVDADNNRGAAELNVAAVVGLSARKTALSKVGSLSAPVTWKITVSNGGPDVANDVVVDEVLRDGARVVAVRPEVGSWDPDSHTWRVSSLTAGQSVGLEIDTVAGHAGPMVNSVAVRSAGAKAAAAEASIEVLPNATQRVPSELAMTGANAGRLVTLGGGVVGVGFVLLAMARATRRRSVR